MNHLPSSSPGRAALCFVLALQILAAGLAAGQSAPYWNRSVDQIAVYLDAAGDPVIVVPLRIEVSNPGTIFDLSTTMSVSVNGTPVGGDITWDVLSENPTQSCELNCGSNCGPLYVDGVINTMLCHETDPADCSCGHWIIAEFPGDGLDAGDLIVVQIGAATGALVDTDTIDDIARLEYPGEPLGWNRRLGGISIQETSVPGRYDVSALIDLRADRMDGFADLSTDVMLSVDDVPEPPLAGVVVHLDSGGGDCETGCGSGCGGMYVDGVFNTMTCRLDGPDDCDCGHWLTVTFPGVELEPAQVVALELVANGTALPEFDTADDGARVVFNGENAGIDRGIKAVAVVPIPSSSGIQRLIVVSQLKSDGANAGIDLSTGVDLSVFQPGGVDTDLSYGWSIYGFNDDDCEFNCGSGCGPMYLDGVFNTLTCRLDGPGDCDCGYWLLAPGGEFDFGEDPNVLITAVARRDGGGAPDADGGSAPWTTTFDGDPIGWNRALDDVRLAPDPAGGWTVAVDFTVAMASIGQFQDMSSEVELQLDGVPVASQVQSLGYEPDPAGDSCQFDCSGGSCGAFNTDPGTWIAAACADWLGFVGCSCGATLSLEFPGVVIPAGAVLTVVLRPAPGGLPELPGFEDDDRREIPDPTTGVGDTVAGVPVGLSQNRPNPFNPSTTIEFRTSQAGPVTLDVYDAQGSLVRRLVNEHRDAGIWSATWDGRDGGGRAVASGHYFYRLRSAQGQQTRKMSLVK